jgi:hypothetical protein
MQIPLPPLVEQQRLVTHLDAIEARLTRAQRLREEQDLELRGALNGAFHQLEVHAEWKPLLEVAPQAPPIQSGLRDHHPERAEVARDLSSSACKP